MKNLKFDINQVVEIRTATLDYFGVGAIQKMHDIAALLRQDGISLDINDYKEKICTNFV